MKGLQYLGDFGDDVVEFSFITDQDESIEDAVEGCPAVILCRASIGADRYGSLVRYVEGGGGLLVIHAGTVGYKDFEPMLSLVGGVFISHPEQCIVTAEITRNNQITAGCSGFSVTDEHYFVEIHDPAIDIYLSTSSHNGSQPGGWVKEHGKGRVCVLTPGHNLEVWQNQEFRSLLRNSIIWCAGQSGIRVGEA